MPLHIRRRRDTGALEITGTVRPAGGTEGIRIRCRAGSDDERLAREEAATLEADILRRSWHGERRAPHSFAEAVVSYLRHVERTSRTKATVRRLLRHFRETRLADINQEAVDKARAAILRHDAGPGTVRRNLLVPLRAILIHASKRGWCDRPDFDMPPEPKGRTAFLLPDQVETLIEAAAPHLRPLIRFLFCTGCRLSEALGLEWEAVDLQGARVLLWEGETKGGDRRVVQLVPAAIAALANLPHREGRVFLTARGAPYRASSDGGGQLRTGWATAARKAGLPGTASDRARPDRSSRVVTFRPVHTPHSARHTWASWHYALHRDLILLQRDGGWSDIKLVTRYAHLVPTGHEAGIRRVWGIDIGIVKGIRA